MTTLIDRTIEHVKRSSNSGNWSHRGTDGGKVYLQFNLPIYDAETGIFYKSMLVTHALSGPDLEGITLDFLRQLPDLKPLTPVGIPSQNKDLEYQISRDGAITSISRVTDRALSEMVLLRYRPEEFFVDALVDRLMETRVTSEPVQGIDRLIPHQKHADLILPLVLLNILTDSQLVRSENVDQERFSEYLDVFGSALRDLCGELNRLQGKPKGGITDLDRIIREYQHIMNGGKTYDPFGREIGTELDPKIRANLKVWSILSDRGYRLLSTSRLSPELIAKISKDGGFSREVDARYLLASFSPKVSRNAELSNKETYVFELALPSGNTKIFAKVYEEKDLPQLELDKQYFLRAYEILRRHGINLPLYVSHITTNTHGIALTTFINGRNLYDVINNNEANEKLIQEAAQTLAILHQGTYDVGNVNGQAKISDDLFLQYVRERTIGRLKRYLGINLGEHSAEKGEHKESESKQQTLEEALLDACSVINRHLIEYAKKDPAVYKDPSPKNWMQEGSLVIPIDFEYNGFTAPQVELACLLEFGKVGANGTIEEYLTEGQKAEIIEKYVSAREMLSGKGIDRKEFYRVYRFAALQKHLEYIGSSARDLKQSNPEEQLTTQSNRLYFHLDKAIEDLTAIIETYAPNNVEIAKYQKLIGVLDRIKSLVLSNPSVRVSQHTMNLAA